MKLDRKLWLTADRSEVVEDGDPRAAYLLGTAGKDISEDEAKRLGLKASKKADAEPEAPAPAPAPAAEAEVKEQAPAADKARKAAKNK